ncbi:ribosome small subunit-dependent GTPase A [Irregularibacter muris]|uniref:Small ribosomal subunit biogenesis GTPase RsgA n=1 Tax=Irregularibacter muris TaxID=1796619 RepID=A0AAE3HEW7_9FIRM|nr:ribosome small subunit-dependent GTPase A [Irregularibacter muris]MCR1898164.1 ribosome small subunit-dependent GTPase A [Irregularibacter muris]
MEKGVIIKGIGGFYYVRTSVSEIVESKARGKFRKDNITPMVGDYVEISTDKEGKGIIETILPRKNQLVRPPVANIDQVIIVFALSNPNPNLQLLDRFLIMAEQQGLSIVICINKVDLEMEDIKEKIKNIYENIEYPVIFTSVKDEKGIEDLKHYLNDHITVFAGPSGVGKSSLLNKINQDYQLETGKVSKKIGRGRHTTRHVELFHYGENGYVVDTPGFSSLGVENIEPIDLMNYFPEFRPYLGQCKFNSCLHMQEPKCAIKEAIGLNKISSHRYESYQYLLEEIKNIPKY